MANPKLSDIIEVAHPWRHLPLAVCNAHPPARCNLDFGDWPAMASSRPRQGRPVFLLVARRFENAAGAKCLERSSARAHDHVLDHKCSRRVKPDQAR